MRGWFVINFPNSDCPAIERHAPTAALLRIWSPVSYKKAKGCTHRMNEIERIMRLAPVIPVLVIEDAARARSIAEALVAGGLRALEVTLRTPAAFAAIEAMAKVEGAVVGAGTVLIENDLDRALGAGAR